MHNCTERGEVRGIEREFSMPYEVLKPSLASIFFPPHYSPPPKRTSSPSCSLSVRAREPPTFRSQAHKLPGQNIYYFRRIPALLQTLIFPLILSPPLFTHVEVYKKSVGLM